MALTRNQLIKLQGSARFRQLIALSYANALAFIYRNIPTLPADDATQAQKEEYNALAQKFNTEIEAKGKLERAIEIDGKANIFSTVMLVRVVATYLNLTVAEDYVSDAYKDDNEITEDTKILNSLIDEVLDYTEDVGGNQTNIIEFECIRLIKSETLKAKVLEIA